MSAKPSKRNWNDVQTAIATAAIVTTLGMWNLFASPAKTTATQATDPAIPPTDPPTDVPASSAPTAMPHVKIMFTPGAPQTTTTAFQQPAQQQQQQAPQKKKHNGGGGGGSSAPVTQTKSS